MSIGPLTDVLWPAPLTAAPSTAFALIDAAADDTIFPALVAADCEWLCLYRGNAAVSMAEVAPYLVQLDPYTRFTSWLFDRGWGKSWAVFAIAPVPIERLQTHFRRLLMAHLPDGRNVFFRFYDPRVLRAYLPTCTDDELRTVFGPVARYAMEDSDGGVVTFDRTSDPLHVAEPV
ncbi:MAG: DUF4123 domain-containing protein [Thermoanaerobaculia bacterium]